MTFEIPERARREINTAEQLPLPAPEPEITGRYFGRGATRTEVESGVEVERENVGRLRPGSAGHRALAAFASFGRRRATAYEASCRATGDYHALRREATRLLVRGFLAKDGVLPNPAPRGRPHVDAYVLTDAGEAEYERLGRWP